MRLEFTPRQNEFIKAALSGLYKYLLFGGAIRGGKSYVAIGLAILLCKMFPGSRWAITRKDLPTLKRNTIPTFNAIRPSSFVGAINQSTWTATCTNGSEIVFFPESAKGDKDLDRWKGLEVNGFIHEEMNEISEKSFDKSIERAGTWKCPGKNKPPILVIGTCNPSKGYVKESFYDKWKDGTLEAPWFYLPASIDDNPHLDQDYLDSIETMRTRRPKAYRRFVLGDWDALDEEDQIISKDDIRYYGGPTGIELPKLKRQWSSWDLNAGAETDDGSNNCGQVWGEGDGKSWLLDQVLGRWKYTVLKTNFRKVAADWPYAKKKRVEKKAAGAPLLDDLEAEFGDDLVPVIPHGTKETRLEAVAEQFEEHLVWFPHPSIAPWVVELVEELVDFPASKGDDQVDTLSQALDRGKKKKPFVIFSASDFEDDDSAEQIA